MLQCRQDAVPYDWCGAGFRAGIRGRVMVEIGVRVEVLVWVGVRICTEIVRLTASASPTLVKLVLSIASDQQCTQVGLA